MSLITLFLRCLRDRWSISLRIVVTTVVVQHRWWSPLRWQTRQRLTLYFPLAYCHVAYSDEDIFCILSIHTCPWPCSYCSE
jgi:hypothetical protein